MVSPVSRHRLRPRAGREPLAEIPLASLQARKQPPAAKVVEPQVPGNLLCPISLQMMRDPVRSSVTGITYDRECVVVWANLGFTECPVTGRPLGVEDLEPNRAALGMVKKWIATHLANGVDPERRPATVLRAVLAAAARRGEGPVACAQLPAKAVGLGNKEGRRRGA